MHMDKQIIIRTKDLHYNYGQKEPALSGIDLCVNKGEIYGFLGPNGSGKTTTLSLLLGLLRKQQGSIEIFGSNTDQHRREILQRIGSLVEAPSLYPNLTATENLEIYRRIYRIDAKRINEVLEIAGLQEAGNKIVKRFSLGMKQRLSIALALLPKPELLILDEPTNGLDPSGIVELRTLLKMLNAEEGTTILVSSHLLAEVEKMATHLGIIVHGKMLFQGSLQQLHQFQQRASFLHIQTSDNEAAMKILKQYKPLCSDDFISVSIEDTGQIAALNRMLIANNIDVFLLQPRTKDLEQLFIDLTTYSS